MSNSEPVSQSSISTNSRPLILDILLILGLLLIFACTASVFLIPWIPTLPLSNFNLNRYIPVSDGDAWLGETVIEANGSSSFRSINIRVLAPQRALTSDLRLSAMGALQKFVQKPGEKELNGSQLIDRISTMQIILEDDQNLAVDGKIGRSTLAILRTDLGDYQLATYYPAENRDMVFDPPMLLRPADFQPGAKWQTDGNLGNLQYRSSGIITDESGYQSPLGNLNDCVKAIFRIEISQEGQLLSDTTYADWYCSGIGLVAEQELDANGKILSRLQIISNTRGPNEADLRKPISRMPVLSMLDHSTKGANIPDPAGWDLNMIGKTRTTNDTTESTIQPLWVPTDPPLLLAAGYGGDLMALDITQSPGKVLWRFHPKGSIYGQPTFDLSLQQVYFGTSGKQMVALDLSGLYRWSFDCSDNIVTSPVVVGDTLVFGSEDRNVYALDARSGALLWKYSTGGAVVASPTLDGNNVIIGSDDGLVYAFDASSGETQWVFLTDDAVEAPLISENGIIFIASRDMNLYAVQATSGKQIWKNKIGHLLRTKPAIGNNAVYVIDENGHLSAVDKTNGKLLWTSVEQDYEGAPVLVGNMLLAAGKGGIIYQLSEDGKRLSFISATNTAPTLQDIDFRLGLVEGGDATWMVDTKGYIWRFGPTWSSAQPLELLWTSNLNTPPFKGNPFYSAPQIWRSQFIVTDQGGNIFQINTATCKTEFLGSINNGIGDFRTGLVVEGDTLLASSGNIIYAVNLPQISPKWQFQGDDVGLMPASVDGNVVAWVTGGDNNPSSNLNTLNLIDLTTGKLNWKVKLEGSAFPGNAIIHNDVIYVNSPISAIKLDNGQKIWEAATENAIGIGQSVLSSDGATLYSAISNTKGQQNRIVAISAHTGNVRWIKDLGNNSLSNIGTLLSDGDILIVPLSNGMGGILALDSITGNELWQYTPDEPRLGNPSIYQGAVWLILENGQVVEINLSDGFEIARLGLTQAGLESYNFMQSITISGESALAPMGWSLLEIKVPELKYP